MQIIQIKTDQKYGNATLINVRAVGACSKLIL